MVKLINDQNFRQEISDGVCVVDMYADWCGPCRALSPVLEDISNSMFDLPVKFFKLNVDDSPNVPNEFGVMGIPTVIIFKDGVEVERLVGLYPRSAYVDKIRSVLGN